MEKNAEFDDIRPFYDDEINPVIQELLKDNQFRKIVDFFTPEEEQASFIELMKTIQTKKEFQQKIVKGVVGRIRARSVKEFNSSGFENISNKEAYTYTSNHRDIVLDAAFLGVTLDEHNYKISEIAIGDNLLLFPWIKNIVRINKSFIVKRGISGRQQLEESIHLSKYIHFVINEKHESVWIAQREGRAKDSNDKTQESVLKMLAIGGDKKNFLENIKELNIAPVTLSYEYDPCDYLKAKEFQNKRDDSEFKKSKEDDLLNMRTGIEGYKGNVHLQFGKPINRLINQINPDLPKNELIFLIASSIDKEIYLNYKFYPGNYIAYDRLWGNHLFQDKYTSTDVSVFNEYLNQQLNKIDLKNKDVAFLTQKLLEMYANPIKNYLSVKE
ncbi:MAG: 1-acyl-sn-glycerol-3-phosphate acyltransferase [Dysgonamonadaceae bacterium]|jgi:hypothetical protein|nr:1-acyl-sn-glycerol-3-phosphate acyltransferase [Dysgonamonadaceae bacterium]